MSLADYSRRANKNYQDKFDNTSVRLPKGTKERIKAITNGGSLNEYMSTAILEQLERDEKHQNKEK